MCKSKLFALLAVSFVLSLASCRQTETIASISPSSPTADSTQDSSSKETTPIEENKEAEVVISLKGPSSVAVGKTIQVYVFTANDEEAGYTLKAQEGGTGEVEITDTSVTGKKAGNVVLEAVSNKDASKKATLGLTITTDVPSDADLEKTYDFGEVKEGEEVSGYSIKAYKGKGIKEIDVPSSYKGKAITAIDDNAFKNADAESIVLPEGITSIGKSSFDGALAKDIVLPSTLTTLGNVAFGNMVNLVSLNIPGSVKTIPLGLIKNDVSLVSLTLNEGTTTIEPLVDDSVSDQGYALNKVILPSTLTTLDTLYSEGAFQHFRNLNEKSLFIKDEKGALKNGFPAALKDVKDAAFADTGFTSITIPSTWKLGTGVFAECVYLENAILEEGITSIPESTFEKCLSLSSVSFPSSLTEIGNSAFAGDPLFKLSFGVDLSKVTFGASVFKGSSLVGRNIDFVKNLTNVPDSLLEGTNLASTIELSPNLEKIGNRSFADNVFLSNFIWKGKVDGGASLPSTVTEVSSGAFNGDNFTSFIFPKSIKTVGQYVFTGNNNLKTIGYEEGITALPTNSFASMNLTQDQMVIPSSVTDLGISAFKSNSSLKSFDFTKLPNVTSISNYAFNYNSSLTSVIVTDKIIAIGDHAFDGASSLKEFTVPKGLETVGEAIFTGATSLNAINVHNGTNAEALKTLFANDGTSFTQFDSKTKSLTINFDGTQEQFDALGITIPDQASGLTLNVKVGQKI